MGQEQLVAGETLTWKTGASWIQQFCRLELVAGSYLWASSAGTVAVVAAAVVDAGPPSEGSYPYYFPRLEYQESLEFLACEAAAWILKMG